MLNIVIFGASGDLSTKKIIPALYNLFANRTLPDFFTIHGFSRRDWDDNIYRQISSDFIRNDISSGNQDSREVNSLITNFLEHLNFTTGEFHNNNGYESLSSKINPSYETIFYFSVAPEFYSLILDKLKSTSLNKLVSKKTTRLVIEKPFGNNYKTALQLNNKIKETFDEEQIFRIDHILGKDTLQDILAFRSNNYILHELLNHKCVDHIQISYLENIDIGERWEFYDQAGVIRDMVQNHLIQALAISTLEIPDEISPRSLSRARCNIIDSISPINLEKDIVIGQYDKYKIQSKKPDSKQVSFVALKTFLNHPLWKNTPIYIRTGKALYKKTNEILFVFKNKNNSHDSGLLPNILGFRLSPNEGVFLNLTKADHTTYTNRDAELNNVSLDFCYKGRMKNSYENLLHNVIFPDRTFFVTIDEVLKAWKFVDPIIEYVEKSGKSKLKIYESGSRGPKEADSLIQKDKRIWLTDHFSDVCRI